MRKIKTYHIQLLGEVLYQETVSFTNANVQKDSPAVIEKVETFSCAHVVLICKVKVV